MMEVDACVQKVVKLVATLLFIERLGTPTYLLSFIFCVHTRNPKLNSVELICDCVIELKI